MVQSHTSISRCPVNKELADFRERALQINAISGDLSKADQRAIPVIVVQLRRDQSSPVHLKKVLEVKKAVGLKTNRMCRMTGYETLLPFNRRRSESWAAGWVFVRNI
jgi:hypothetical protein